MHRTVRNQINGQWREADSSGYLDVENPSTGEILAQVPLSTTDELDRAAAAAFPRWSATPVARRCEPLYRLAKLIQENGEPIPAACRILRSPSAARLPLKQTSNPCAKGTTMRALFSVLTALLITTLSAAAADAKIKLLLITGDDEVVHKWRETSVATGDILVNSGKFDVKIVEDLSCLENADDLKRYDVIFLHRYHRTGQPSDKVKENLLSFVKGGKGFVVAHLASASFGPTVKREGDTVTVVQKGWEEFNKLCGRCWGARVSGHGPRAKFTVNIAHRDHPITKGIQDFEADDDLYANLQGDAPINILATADSDWSKKTEPLVFTLEYGKGRVFHEAFGHDVTALKNASISKLICRGCEWAATGKVE